VHVNYAPIPSAPEGLSVSSLSERDKAGYERGQEFVKTSAAYAYEQATRPSTVGIALGSSPLAVLAWVGEKLMCWPDDPLPLELILEEVTLYWFTESMARGIYPYRGVCCPSYSLPCPAVYYILC
jgi:microsomal epoxide hydrolase